MKVNLSKNSTLDPSESDRKKINAKKKEADFDKAYEEKIKEDLKKSKK